MSDFVDSLRSDLLGRRLRLVVALLAIALIAAIVYAVLAGSGSSAPTALSPVAPPAAGVRLTPVGTEASQASAETTSGAGQSSGATRNPFKPLSEPKAKAASTSPAGASPSSGSTASGSQPNASTGPETSPESKSSSGAAPSKPKAQKPQTVYRVSVGFGVAAPGTPVDATQLTPFANLARQQPLPSAQQALIVFRGVVAGGKSATFTLVGEAILRGTAVCRPSAAQCQTIDLKAGQTEELEYAPPGAAPTNYLLHIVSIDSAKATASAARRILARESTAGARLLRSTDLEALPGLRYSAAKGVLVFAGSRAHDARASIATVAVLDSAPQAPSVSK